MKKYRIVERIRADGSKDYEPQELAKNANRDGSPCWDTMCHLCTTLDDAKAFIERHKNRDIIQINIIEC